MKRGQKKMSLEKIARMNGGQVPIRAGAYRPGWHWAVIIRGRIVRLADWSREQAERIRARGFCVERVYIEHGTIASDAPLSGVFLLMGLLSRGLENGKGQQNGKQD
jgi:hypothetical protein